MPHPTNADIQPAVDALIASTSTALVMESQPAKWNPTPWRTEWTMNPPLPRPIMLQALEREMTVHKLIRRRFVFGYADGNPIDLLIGAMAWGYGTDNRRGSKNARAALTGGDPPDRVIGAGRNALTTESTSAGFSAMFAYR